MSQKNCAKLFLSELRQISTNFYNFWQKDGKEAKIMRGVLIFHLTQFASSHYHVKCAYMWNNMLKLFYFTCNHVWNYFKIILAAERALKLFQNNFGDIQHVGKYLWAAISVWNYLEIISHVVTCEIKHWNNCQIISVFYFKIISHITMALLIFTWCKNPSCCIVVVHCNVAHKYTQHAQLRM